MARRTGAALLAATLVVSALGACGSGEAEPETTHPSAIEVTDAAGRVLRLDAPVRRIVSLVPSATLTLDRLGARHLLVGRTDYDQADWAAGLPSVGGGIQPSYEAVVALQPDLVIRFAGEQDAETPAALDRVGIPHLAIRPDAVEDIRTAIRLLGTVTGHEDGAEALLLELDAELERVRRRAAELPEVRVAYVLGGTPPWVAGPGTFVHEILEMAGGVNVFADLDRLYSAVSPEELVARDIDVVLTPVASSVPDWLAERAEVREVGDLLELPGPHVGYAAQAVARILHGEAW